MCFLLLVSVMRAETAASWETVNIKCSLTMKLQHMTAFIWKLYKLPNKPFPVNKHSVLMEKPLKGFWSLLVSISNNRRVRFCSWK